MRGVGHFGHVAADLGARTSCRQAVETRSGATSGIGTCRLEADCTAVLI